MTSQFGKNWNLQAGLRAEQTRSRGTSLTVAQTTARQFLNLFPSVFLQQTVTPTYQISYQYSRRINRPRYEDLNPFVYFIDPYTVSEGNPALRPQYANSFQIVQSWKSQYTLTLNYATTRDYQAQVPLQNSRDTLTIYQQQNLDRYEELNGTLSIPVRITAKWQASNVLTAGYQRVRTELTALAVDNGRFTYFAQTNHTVQLPAKLRLEVNGTYVGPGLYGVSRVQGFGWVDAGVKRTFAKDQLEVNLSLTDIFRSRRLGGSVDQGGNVSTFSLYRNDQSVRVTLRYRFDKGEKFDGKRRNNTLEEVNRTDK